MASSAPRLNTLGAANDTRVHPAAQPFGGEIFRHGVGWRARIGSTAAIALAKPADRLQKLTAIVLERHRAHTRRLNVGEARHVRHHRGYFWRSEACAAESSRKRHSQRAIVPARRDLSQTGGRGDGFHDEHDVRPVRQRASRNGGRALVSRRQSGGGRSRPADRSPLALTFGEAVHALEPGRVRDDHALGAVAVFAGEAPSCPWKRLPLVLRRRRLIKATLALPA